jgi:hypothetical protein
MRRNFLCRKVLPIALFLVASSVVGIGAASGAKSTDPFRYRYAGVVENGRGIPTHYVARGDGIAFSFFDSLSQGRKSHRYQLCIDHSGKGTPRCLNRTGRFGVGRIVFPFTLPSDVPLGELTARWLVAGRTVATWRFLYVRGGG